MQVSIARFCRLMFMVSAFVQGAAPSAFAQGAPAAAPQFDPATTKLVVSVPGMADVRVREQVPFKTVEGRQLSMDVYAPRSGGPHPAVVLVSGASEVRAWGLYKDYGRIIGASNMVAVIPDKRYDPGPQSMEHGAADTLDLLAHLRKHAADYGIDPNKICMWTFSAGGSLAQLGIAPNNGLSCVAAYYGLGQAGPKLALVQHAAKMPPMLLVRAGRDNPGLNNAIDAFAMTALSLNAPVTVLNYPEGVHAFEVHDTRPEPREPANIRHTERIFRITLEWIAQQLR